MISFFPEILYRNWGGIYLSISGGILVSAKAYQFTLTFFTSHKRSKTSETRMHYTMCWPQLFICLSLF